MSKTELLEGTGKSKSREDCERAKSLQLFPTLCNPNLQCKTKDSVQAGLRTRVRIREVNARI